MTGESEPFVERLRPMLATGDVFSAQEFLMALEGDDLREAKTWFASGARWCRDLSTEVEYVGDDHDARFVAYHDASWIVSMCAVVLCGPRTAAERVLWANHWDYQQHQGEAAFVQLLWDRPAGWVAEFVDAASHVRLGPQARNVNGMLSRVLRAAVVHHELPCPTGPTFLNRWLAGTPAFSRLGKTESSLADWLAVDPLMPELLHAFLVGGECGAWPALPDAVAELVSADRLDRAAVVETVLGQLTANRRPATQRVLATMLGAVELRADEVKGGLDYLLGVIASGDRGVQPVLLPLALQLADTAEDWIALADVVAGRPDKKAKEVVLAALKKPAVLVSPGAAVVAAVLDVLGAGDDAAFVAKVAAVRSKLGLETSDPVDQGGALGLWESSPIPSGLDLRPHFLFRHGHTPGWQELLSSKSTSRDTVRPWLVEETLSAMARGSYDASSIFAVVETLLARQVFLCSSAADVFEELFLAGGLRQGWSTALAVAELAAGAPLRPAGLAVLVRVLARYAPDVPGPVVLPPHLAALAAEPSGTKTAMEARALSAALGEPAMEESAPQAMRSAPPRHGLWDAKGEHHDPMPSTIRIDDDPFAVRAETMAGLRGLLSENFNGWAQSYVDVCWRPAGYQAGPGLTGLTEPDRVLAATVRAIHRHGPDDARAAIRGIEREYAPIDVIAAVDAWAEDGLDPGTFWRLASTPVLSDYTLRRQWSAEGATYAETQERFAALPSFASRLRLPIDPELAALVIPMEIDHATGRFAFLRAAEALIRAEFDPVLLSLPTWRDGTLDADDLLARLETVSRGSGVVGPIDLVQALHRLREVDARLVDRVPRGLRTDPRFTAPDGVASWDVTDLVQKWLALGGLPVLEPQVQDGRWHGPPTAPVPFTSLAAWPAELADDPWNPGSLPAVLRLYPRWADRAFDEAFGTTQVADPRSLPTVSDAARGVPFHDRLLTILVPEYNRESFQAHPMLVYVAQDGRIDPSAVAAAARGRHEAGTLDLNLLAKALQRGLEKALRGVWPMTLAIGDVLCTVDKRPTQLAELLRVLTSFAHEVPPTAATVPPGLLAFAESKGSTKAHVAARELVEALRQATTP